MTSELFFNLLFDGIARGCIYAIVAIGFNIIYNTTGIINFAQGEFVMLGAMISAWLVVPTAAGGVAGLPLPLAIGAAVILVAVIGVAIEIIFIRWLEEPSVLRMIVITIGISLLLREAALLTWGRGAHVLPYFSGNETSAIVLLGASFSPQVLWVIGTCLVIVAALTLFFQYSTLGREMRACAANRTGAILCGINTRNLVTMSFALSAAIGALAGCVLCPITATRFDAGAPLAIKGFTVAILGGLGNSTGAVLAGVLLGTIEAFTVWQVSNAYKEVVALVILLIVLCVRPAGLFGSASAGRLKEF